MHARKYILIVATERSHLARVATGLRDLDFRISVTDSSRAGLEFIRKAPSISLVAIEGSLVDAPDQFMCELRDQSRNLPVIWAKADSDAASPADEGPFVALEGRFDAQEFSRHANEMLVGDVLPAGILQGFTSACNRVISLTCDLAVEVGDCYIKQTNNLPGAIHAYIGFMDRDANGHLLLSADQDVFCRLGEAMFLEDEGKPKQLAVDVAGELVNQIIGRMKSECGDGLRGVQLGIPVVWAGEPIEAIFHTTSLSLELRTEVGTLFTNLAFQRFAVEEGATGLESDFMAAGEMAFF